MLLLGGKNLSVLFAILAACVVLAAAKVEQVHMATGTTSSEMILSWITQSADDASVVKYSKKRLSENKDVMTSEGTASTYTFHEYTSGYIHKVTLTGLSPSTKYYYSVGDYDNNGELNFMTLPAPGNGEGVTLVYGIVGDLGQTKYSESTIRHISRNSKIRAIIHAGDLSYANCLQPLWDTYGKMIQPVSERMPWMISVGNHEIEWTDGDEGENLFKAVESRFPMPEVKPAEFGGITYPKENHKRPTSCTPSAFSTNYDYGIAFYSYESGLSHMIHLNCYSEVGQDSKQYKWLESDLKSIDRTRTPWVFVIEHCPLYNSNTAHQNEEQTLAMKSSMEELFYTHKVNVVFAGHVHAYERSHPVYKDQVDSNNGVVYINIGDGGNKEGHSSVYLDPHPEWSAFRNGSYFGHGEMEVHNSSALTWRWIRNVDHEAVSADEISICNGFLNAGASSIYC